MNALPDSVTAERDVDDKINLLILVAALGIGGAEVVVQRLVQTLDRRRFNVTIGCIKGSGPIAMELARQGTDVVVLSKGDTRKNGYLSFIRLLRLVRDKRIHVVHTHTTDSLVDAALCKLFAPKLKLIHTFHFGNYPHRPWQTLLMERISSRLANRLVAVGEAQRQQLISVYRFRDSAIQRVWNGVVCKPTRSGDAFRRSIGASGKILIGTTATLTEQKGLFDFLAVARLLVQETDNLRFVIVGDGNLRGPLEAARRDLGLEESVVLAGWIKDASDVALPSFDIFFQPSLWEAMSISLLEAMAAGKATVATRVGETPYIIDDGVDGLLVQPRDVNGMAAVLRRLIDDSELRNRLGRAAANKARQRLTVGEMTRAYEQLYLATAGAGS